MATELEEFLGVTPRLPIPGETADPRHHDIQEVYLFKPIQLKFLSEFGKTLSLEAACSAVGISQTAAKKWMEMPQFKEEVTAIYDAWKQALRMNAMQGASKFLNILNKMEADYNSGLTKVAAPLAKMAGDYLRATGYFDDKKTGGSSPAVQVNVQLNTVAPKEVRVQTKEQHGTFDM